MCIRDRAELQLVDLHVDIDSTLTLIQHLFRDRSEIVLNYATLPEVQCFCELGQPGGHEPVTNADTGHGIEPEKLERVFDPGFTTKGGGVDVGFVYRLPYHRGAQGLDRAPERSG